MGLQRREPAEVEEAQRSAVDLVARRTAGDLAIVQVPVRDVAARVLPDRDVEVRRREVHPPLIDETTLGRADEALAAQPVGPPVEHRRAPGPDRDEPQVVGAGLEHHGLVGEPTVGVERRGHVRGEHDVVDRQQLLEVAEVRVDDDVGVEVAGGAAAPLEQRPQQERLGRGRELGDLVDHRHRAELLLPEPDVAGQQRRERLVAEGVALVLERVDDQHVEHRPSCSARSGPGPGRPRGSCGRQWCSTPHA